MRNNEKRANNVSIVVSAIIISITILLIEMLGNYLFKNIEFSKTVAYLLRALMYVITIAFTQFVIQKVSNKNKSERKK